MNEQFKFRLDERTKEQLRQLAELEMRSQSDYLRLLIKKEAEKKNIDT